MMPNGNPRDEFFDPTLTLMIDSYALSKYEILFSSSHVFGICSG